MPYRMLFVLVIALLCASPAMAQEATDTAQANAAAGSGGGSQDQPAEPQATAPGAPDSSATQVAADQQLDPEEQARKEAAAQKYLRNIDLQQSFDGIYAALQERLPGESGASVIMVMRENVDMDKVKDMVKQTLKAHYTVEELEALAEFYSSEVGRSISMKLPAYLEDVNIAIQQEAERAFRVAVEQIQKKAMEKLEAEQAQKQAEEQKAAPEAEAPAAEESDPAGAESQKDATEAPQASEAAPEDAPKAPKWQRKGGEE